MKKPYFQNFSWFQFYVKKFMHNYTVFHRSIHYCYELTDVDDNLYENCSNKMFFLEENYKKMQKIINFEKFKSVPFMICYMWYYRAVQIGWKNPSTNRAYFKRDVHITHWPVIGEIFLGLGNNPRSRMTCLFCIVWLTPPSRQKRTIRAFDL